MPKLRAPAVMAHDVRRMVTDTPRSSAVVASRYSTFCTTKYSPSFGRTVKRNKYGMDTTIPITAQTPYITSERTLWFRLLYAIGSFMASNRSLQTAGRKRIDVMMEMFGRK